MRKFTYSPQIALGAVWHQLLLSVRAGLFAGLTLLLAGLVSPAEATGFYKDYVVINGSYYYTNNSVSGTAFQNHSFNSFDRGGQNGDLILGGEAGTFSDNGDQVQPPQMLYRVYLQNTTPGPFTPLNLTYLRSGDDGNATNQTWANTTTRPSLLAATNGPGNYVLEVLFKGTATYNNNGYSGSIDISDDNGSQNYKAFFTVTGTVPAQWTGDTRNDTPDSWGVKENWSTGQVPTQTTDVTIPASSAGSINPRITTITAQARTLTLLGDVNIPGSTTLVQAGGELRVYGNFVDNNGSFNQYGGAFTMAGYSAQTFTGGKFYTIQMEGGGTKTLQNRMDILTSLTFQNGGGQLITRTDNTTVYNIDLGIYATISGETETSYVLGVLRMPGRFVDNKYVDFGNMGIEFLATTGIPGITTVTRITGPDTFRYQGPGTSQSIRRGFIFTPDNPTGLTYNLVFHYLDVERYSIPEDNLRLFRSSNGTPPFEALGKTSNDASANTLTRTGITSPLNATFTLGDAANPLPVTLTSFMATATAQGAALLRWATATESNNRGFGIERQLGANEAWQSVGFVAAGATTGSTYEFTDKSLVNAPASAQAYYRLRQEDLNGKVTYSPVAAINRTAAVAATELTLSPVPVSGTDNLSVGLAEAGQAGIMVAVINTQGQRLMSFTTEASTDGALSLPVTSLAAGVYIVTVQVPGQAARHARFVKL